MIPTQTRELAGGRQGGQQELQGGIDGGGCVTEWRRGCGCIGGCSCYCVIVKVGIELTLYLGQRKQQTGHKLQAERERCGGDGEKMDLVVSVVL